MFPTETSRGRLAQPRREHVRWARFHVANHHDMTDGEGLKSEALRGALATALAGRTAPLEALLCRSGGGSDRRPNFRLAAAFGAELGGAPGPVARLLARFAANDAAPDTSEVFLPIAAAFGWAARLAAGLDAVQASA